MDGSVTWLEQEYPDIEIIKLSSNEGFGRACNYGIQAADADLILLLNNDTMMQPGFLANLMGCLQSSTEEVVAVQPKMMQMSDTSLVDDVGNKLSWYGEASKVGYGESGDLYNRQRPIFSPSGGASLFRRSFLMEMGGVDADFFAYLEDIDLGLRGRLRGYTYSFCPDALILHQGHGSEISKSTYVKLITCNRLLLWTKNIPVRLWLKYLGPFIYGQVYFFLAYRKPLSSIKGYIRFFRLLPKAMNERRALQKFHTLTHSEIEPLLLLEKPVPNLMALISGYMKGSLRVLGRVIRSK